MKNQNSAKIFGVVVVVLIIAIAGLAFWKKGGTTAEPGKYDALAQCLKDEGAVFYGAFWCQHCQNQKKMFGPSAQLLAYVECSTLDGKGQVPACIEKKISGYPTWEFADGSRLSGEVPMAQLAEKTGCTLQEDASTIPAETGASSPAQ